VAEGDGDYPWYGLAGGPSLRQGDVLARCPAPQFALAEGGVEDLLAIPARDWEGASLEVIFYATVVVSQSCDLAAGKLDLVTMCACYDLTTMQEAFPQFGERGHLERIRRGEVVRYHMLNACHLPGCESDLRVVDLNTMLGLPLSLAQDVADVHSPRPRLLPPYREHLAQAVARYYMRVGLPVDIPAFR